MKQNTKAVWADKICEACGSMNDVKVTVNQEIGVASFTCPNCRIEQQTEIPA